MSSSSSSSGSSDASSSSSSSSSTTSSKKHDGDRDVEANHARAKFTSHDLANATLLVLLYVIQGVPLGLATGSIPILLKEVAQLDYAEMGLFSLAGYPYSLKLLWSPFVDSVYWKAFGRRKSWIVPIQTMSGFLLMFVGWHIDEWMAQDEVNVPAITAIFVLIVILTATQDIAVDGWALEMLAAPHRGYAATCQTIGLNIGYFVSFTVFLAFNSPDFSNNYIRIPLGLDEAPLGLFQLGAFIVFWGQVYLVVTLAIALLKKEQPLADDAHEASLWDVYRHVWEVVRLPNMIKLVSILLLCKIGFACFDNVSALKLMDKGYKKENVALTVLIDFPFQLFIGYHAARFAHGSSALAPWLYGFAARIVFALIGTWVVAIYPNPGSEIVPNWYHLLVISSALVSSCTQTIMFVCMSAYFSVISDPVIGGTYMTLLNTFSNLGGTWPQYFVMKAVDFATQAVCVPSPAESDPLNPIWDTSCVHHHERESCVKAGGSCETLRDGFYPVSIVSLAIAILVFVYVRYTIKWLVTLPITAWRIRGTSPSATSEDLSLSDSKKVV